MEYETDITDKKNYRFVMQWAIFSNGYLDLSKRKMLFQRFTAVDVKQYLYCFLNHSVRLQITRATQMEADVAKAVGF